MVIGLRDARNIGLGAVKLLPWRPSRKFQVPQLMEDPALELKAYKAERAANFRATTAEPVLAPAADLAEIKRKRQEEARAAEEKYVSFNVPICTCRYTYLPITLILCCLIQLWLYLSYRALKEEAKREAERKAQVSCIEYLHLGFLIILLLFGVI